MNREGRVLGVAACLMLALAALGVGPVAAADIHIAVAANFTDPLKAIGAEFEKGSGNHLVVSSGSTGKLASQIENGAPFDVLLAADAERPAQLARKGFAVGGSRFTYAKGKLVLWSRDPQVVDPAGSVLRTGHFKHLAIANPLLAPYGRAAQEVLIRLNLTREITPRLVEGEDIGQTYQFVVSGAAELGFVALSQLKADPEHADHGSSWTVPENLYAPIEQQAILLTRSRDNASAQAFLAYLRTPPVRTILERYGYGLP